MATLFDALKNSLNAQQAPAPVESEQQQIQKVLAAKSGKAAGTGGAPKASNLGEAQAINITQAQSAQVGQQAATAAVGVQTDAANLATQDRVFQAGQQAQARSAADEIATRTAGTTEAIAAREQNATAQRQSQELMRTDAINSAASQKLKQMATDKRISVDDIFAEFKASNKELEFRKDAAELEQVGFLLAMQDKAYVDTLEMIGKEQNLRDELSFREEMYRVTFGNELNDLTDKLNFQTKYNADQRAFEMELAKIDINAALQLANAAIRDANNQAIAQGAIDTAKAGADAYMTYGNDSDSDSGYELTSSSSPKASQNSNLKPSEYD
jgi:hypothetical protein